MLSATKRWDEGMWAYDGFSPSNGSKKWSSLEEGLTFILEKVAPVRDKLNDYKKTFSLVFWCGHFQSEWNSSFTLSASTLQLLADLGADLFVDSYISTE